MENSARSMPASQHETARIEPIRALQSLLGRIRSQVNVWFEIWPGSRQSIDGGIA